MREELRKAAEPVRDDATRLFLTRITPRTQATRYGISVRRTGVVAVEQRKRRTTGKRPDFGGLQMREALVPSLNNNQAEVLAHLDRAIEKMSQRWAV